MICCSENLYFVFWYLPFPIKVIKMDFNILSSLIPQDLWIIDKFKHFYLVFLYLNDVTLF
jgi:hypothetical protein